MTRTDSTDTRKPAAAAPRKPKAARAPGTRAPARGTVASLRQELRLSEDRFGSLAETVGLPILVLSRRFTILGLNREAAQVYGRPRQELLGESYLRVTGRGARRGLTRTDLRHVLAGHPARGIEGRLRRPDGTERVLLWNATRLLDPQGRPTGVIAAAQDISERKRIEEALREREARLSLIISSAPEAIVTIDAHGRILSFSNAAEKMFGYAAGEVIGQNVKILMPSPHRERHDSYVQRYLRTGKKHVIEIGREVEGRRKDGTLIPVELSVGEIQLESGRIFTGFMRDLTNRRKMEHELRHAQKMEAIGQLTGGLAHDFNNLLTVITGNLELLERRVAHEADREILEEAQEAADLGAKLADRLLAFGRRQSLNPKPTDLSALVEGMADLLRRTLGRTIEIETRLAPNPRVVVVDPGQVENALLNLVLNARDAMPEGGRVVIETGEREIDEAYARAHPETAPGSFVTLAVRDHGRGMTPDVRQRAFEPFFTTKQTGTGSGLGLSMVYGFVRQSGGHVELFSEPGRGTVVEIRLPARGKARSKEVEMREQQTRDAEVAGRGETILVVEDDPQVRRVSARRLRNMGFSVIEAENAAAALDVLDRAETIDLLLTDIVMPGGMTGVDLARAARRRRPDLRILFTSGYAGPAAIEGDLFQHHAAFLGKPYHDRELAAKLRGLMRS